jgi:hypothetical protein
MLDVHPPHHPTHSWRDFFIHIATIVVGLLIAVGLEQTVEKLHARHELRETRTALAEERELNRKAFEENVRYYRWEAALMHNNLRVFQYLQKHPGTAADKLPGVVYWDVGNDEPIVSAWDAADHAGILKLMPSDEVQADGELYHYMQQAANYYESYATIVLRCKAYEYSEPDLSRLSAAQIERVIALLDEAQAVHIEIGQTLNAIRYVAPDWPPALRPGEIDPYADPRRDLEQRFPAAFAITRQDLVQAWRGEDAPMPREHR